MGVTSLFLGYIDFCNSSMTSCFGLDERAVTILGEPPPLAYNDSWIAA